MGRNKRYRRKRKWYKGGKDPITFYLSIVAVLLVCVWGGFYWNDASAKGLDDTAAAANTAAPGGQEQAAQASAPEIGQKAPEQTGNGQAQQSGQTPATADQTGSAEAQETSAANGQQDEGSSSGDQSAAAAVTDEKPAATPSPQQTASATAGAQQQEQLIASYENELARMQTKCRSDAEAIMAEAEKTVLSMENGGDAVAAGQTIERLKGELAAAEAACNADFQATVGQAEQDGVPAAKIAQWNTAYESSRQAIRNDSEKLTGALN